jgi:hypothetical protein
VLPRTSPTSRRGGRKHRGEAVEGEKGEVTPDLLLKHPNETFTTYVWRQMKHLKHTSETLAKKT